MKINITGHETTLTPELKKYATIKLNKLCKKYKQIIDINLVLEEGSKKTEKKIASAKAQVKVAGPDISATAEARTVFAALDELERKLVRQLDKLKEADNPANTKVAKSKNIIKKLFRRFGQE